MGLNPGGSTWAPPIFSVEDGNAYRIERWDGSRDIQLQMLRMYEELARRWPRPTTAIALMDTSLAAHFCPFRSPDWNSLASRRESIEFSEALSRFRIFGRPESRQAIDRFTTAAANAAA